MRSVSAGSLFVSLLLLLGHAPRIAAQTTRPPRSAATLVVLDVQKPADADTGIVLTDTRGALAFPAALIATESIRCDTLAALSVPATLPTRAHPLAEPRLSQLLAIANCFEARDSVSLRTHLAAARWLAYLAHANAGKSTLRVQSAKGDTIRIAIVHSVTLYTHNTNHDLQIVAGLPPTVTAKEEARSSQIATDIQTAGQLALLLATGGRAAVAYPKEAFAKSTVPWVTMRTEVLQQTRATLTLTAADRSGTAKVLGTTIDLANAEAIVAGSDKAPGAVAEAVTTPPAKPTTPTTPTATKGTPAATADAAASNSVKATLVTGPAEHWFLSVDVPLTSATRLTVNSTTNQVQIANEPSTFYVGVNFLGGDLQSDDRSLLGNLAIKGLITASSHPLQSIGLAIGLRGRYLKRFGLDFELLTPFVGVTFTKQDKQTATGPVVDGSRNRTLRVGASLNLDKAFGFLKSTK